VEGGQFFTKYGDESAIFAQIWAAFPGQIPTDLSDLWRLANEVFVKINISTD